MTTAAIVLALDSRVPEGGQEALESFVAEARPYYESHHARLDLLWNMADPCRFRETMTYRSQADFDADDERTRSDPTMRGYLERWRQLLAEPPLVTVWRSSPLP